MGIPIPGKDGLYIETRPGPWPQIGNRGDRHANEACAGLAGLTIVCENSIGSLTVETCNRIW